MAAHRVLVVGGLVVVVVGVMAVDLPYGGGGSGGSSKKYKFMHL